MTEDKFVETSLPNNKTLSRDAVEILMRLAYKEGYKQGGQSMSAFLTEQERERIHGPMFI